MRVAVIRHDDVDSASFVGEAFEARGAEFDVRLFPGGSLPALERRRPRRRARVLLVGQRR